MTTPERPTAPPERAARALISATVAAMALALLETLAAAATTGAPPGIRWTVAALAAALVAGGVVGGAASAIAWGAARLPAKAVPWAMAAPLAVAAGGVGSLLTSGARAAAHPLRWPAVALMCAMAGGLGWLIGRRQHQLTAWFQRNRAATIAMAITVAGLLALADARVLPGLYPALHWSLRAVALAALGLATWWAQRDAPRAQAVYLSLGALLAGAALAAGALPPRAESSGPVSSAAGWVLTTLTPERTPPRVLLAPAMDPREEGDAPRLALLGSDVFVLSVDALRTDHVGFAGGHFGLTPRLDRFASDGAVALRMYAPAPHSSYALASMFTGHYQYPRVRADAPGRDATLAEWMASLGYRTIAMFNEGIWHAEGERLASYRDSDLGFDEVLLDYSRAHERRAKILEVVRNATKRDAEGSLLPGRLFLWAHLGDPHEPYELHPEAPVASGVAGGPPHAGYASEVSFVDEKLGALVEELRRLRPGAIIIITADHGEAFGEHGVYYHGASLAEEEVRVPFVVVAPGIPAGVAWDGVGSLVDLWPTLAAMLGVEAPEGLYGRSLLAALLGDGLPPRPAFFHNHLGYRGAVIGDDKVVCTSRSRCAFYDLAEDPSESRDLAMDRPTADATLRALLARFDSEQVELAARRTALDAAGTLLARAALGDVTTAPDLRALLEDDAAPVERRARAAALLGDLEDGDAVPALLAVTLEAEGPETLRRSAAIAAALLGERRAFASLKALGPPPAPADDAPYRFALAALKAPGAAVGLTPLLDHPLGDVRKRALTLLAELKDAEAAPALVTALARWQTRPLAAVALAALGDRTYVPALITALETEAQVLHRAMILDALARLGGPRAELAILEHVTGADDAIGAVAALEKAGALGRHFPRATGPASTRDGFRCEPDGSCAAVAAETTVRIPSSGPVKQLVLTLRAPAEGTGTVRLFLADPDTELATLRLAGGWRDFHIPLSEGRAGSAGERTIRLVWSDAPGPDGAYGWLRYAVAVAVDAPGP